MWEDSSATRKLLHTLGLLGTPQRLWLQRGWEEPLAVANVAVVHKAGILTPAGCCCQRHAVAQLPTPPTLKHAGYRCFPVVRKLTWLGKHRKAFFAEFLLPLG